MSVELIRREAQVTALERFESNQEEANLSEISPFLVVYNGILGNSRPR